MIRDFCPPTPLYLEPVDIIPHPFEGSYDAITVFGGAASALSIVVWRPGATVPRTVIRAGEVENWLAGLADHERVRCDRILRHWRVAPAFPGLTGHGHNSPSLMGVVNLTNDSFFSDSTRPDAVAGIELGRQLFADGASILDIGGQSTRPGSAIVAQARELEAVLPVVTELAKQPACRLSIDTIRPEVAKAAVRAGASIINDVTGMMPAEALGGTAGLVVGHMRGNPATMQKWPRSERGIFSLYDWLERRISTLETAGISRNRIAIDPGFGFGKAVSHNHAVIRHLPILTGLGVAIVIGLSRKASLGYLSGAKLAAERLPASLAAALAAARQGATILRVHDVAATRQALQISSIFR